MRALHPSYSLIAPRIALTKPLILADTLRERPARLCLPPPQGEDKRDKLRVVRREGKVREEGEGVDCSSTAPIGPILSWEEKRGKAREANR
jgi:hypothetical protein